jgi:hypothetical protein
MVAIEVQDAYTDGTSRFDNVFVAAEKFRGNLSREQRQQAVWDALDAGPDDLIGQPAEAPSVTKAVAEDALVRPYERWQRWKVTRIEAQARGMPAPVVNALTAREDLAWLDYVAAVQAWRAAP